MRTRALSSIGVVLVGLVPAFVGGVVFAVVYGLILLIAFHELTRLLCVSASPIAIAGYPLIVFGVAIPLWLTDRGWFPLLMGLTLFLPVAIALSLPLVPGRLAELSAVIAAALYLVLPAFALVSIRMTPGDVSSGWLSRLAEGWAPGWAGHPRGLAWFLTALLVTWLSDTGAYLVGRSLGRLAELSAAIAAALYLVLPAFALVSIRMTPGDVSSGWLSRLAEGWAPGWAGHPRGLAWFLTALLVTWLSDTGAYLVGRSLGRHHLAPHISPNKTVEGALGGLAAAAITAAICVAAFGLGLAPLVAAALGIGLAIIGIGGDLAESLIKRQAGVKDSGSLIPGHGGMLDRIDAFVFVSIATWISLPMLEHLARSAS